jgi:hypothetical protein
MKALKQALKLRSYLKKYDVEVKITGLSEAYVSNPKMTGESEPYHYPETLEITIENWSTTHYSIRTEDCCFVRSGQNLMRTQHIPLWKVFRMHLKEVKAFEAYKQNLKVKECGK